MNVGPHRSPSLDLLSAAARLSDAELSAQVKRLARREREATVALIAHLAEIDRRRLYLAAGCSSIFTYCTRVLHLSEHAAYRRIEAARLARRLPVVLERIAEGTVTLTTVGLLSVHLTPQNHLDLLDQARYKTRREVESLVAALRPRPEVPAQVRKLPTPGQAASPATPPAASPATPPAAGPATPPAAVPDVAAAPPGADLRTTTPDLTLATLEIAAQALTSAPAPEQATPGVRPGDHPRVATAAHPNGDGRPAARPAVVAPLAPQRYRVQLTVDAETVRKLREAQALMRHQIPDGDLAKILDRALTALLRDLSRQKFAATDRPRPGPGPAPGAVPAPGSRHIPAEVRRAVWARDGGQCGFVGTYGLRCLERSFLEFHHVVPHALGGAPTVDNIQLRCRAHNSYEAGRHFGQPAGPTRPPPVRQ
jgi:hypothetical protein